VLTLVLDGPLTAAGLGEELEHRGFWLNFRSSHLRSRNWIQISLLGDPPRQGLEQLVHALRVICGTERSATNASNASAPTARS
jgi:hypothetical protein